jgi:hypothetical protein
MQLKPRQRRPSRTWPGVATTPSAASQLRTPSSARLTKLRAMPAAAPASRSLLPAAAPASRSPRAAAAAGPWRAAALKRAAVGAGSSGCAGNTALRLKVRPQDREAKALVASSPAYTKASQVVPST